MTITSINILAKSRSIMLSFQDQCWISDSGPVLWMTYYKSFSSQIPPLIILHFVTKSCLGRCAPESHCTSRPTNTVPSPSGLAYTKMAPLLLFHELMVWHHCNQQKSLKTMNERWECKRDIQLVLNYLLALKGWGQNIFLAQYILLNL